MIQFGCRTRKRLIVFHNELFISKSSIFGTNRNGQNSWLSPLHALTGGQLLIIAFSFFPFHILSIDMVDTTVVAKLFQMVERNAVREIEELITQSGVNINDCTQVYMLYFFNRTCLN